MSLIPGYYPSNTAKDPFFSDVMLLMHFDGADGSTVFKDASANNYAFTSFGTPTLSATNAKIGSAALALNGLNGIYKDPAAVTWAGMFTVECFVKIAPTQVGTGDYFLLDMRSTATAGFSLHLNSSSQIQIFYGIGSWGTSLALPTNTWMHLAACRDAAGLNKIYIDGVQSGSAPSNTNSLVNGSITVGSSFQSRNTTANSHFNGWIDELRVTRNVCRYTGNFTVPTSAYPDR
jgi:hypothetical protein